MAQGSRCTWAWEAAMPPPPAPQLDEGRRQPPRFSCVQHPRLGWPQCPSLRSPLLAAWEVLGGGGLSDRTRTRQAGSGRQSFLASAGAPSCPGEEGSTSKEGTCGVFYSSARASARGWSSSSRYSDPGSTWTSAPNPLPPRCPLGFISRARVGYNGKADYHMLGLGWPTEDAEIQPQGRS